MPMPMRGHVELIAGGMYSGKTEELIRRLTRAKIAKQRCGVFKPLRDTRQAGVASRCGTSLEAVTLVRATDLLEHAKDLDVVGIDEGQFFDEGLRDVAFELARRGKRVMIAFLNADYAARPFPSVSPLYAVAADITLLRAICVRCGAEASCSQRLTAAREQVAVGDTETYEARCIRCFEPPADALP